jgi:hypothetical protein
LSFLFWWRRYILHLRSFLWLLLHSFLNLSLQDFYHDTHYLQTDINLWNQNNLQEYLLLYFYFSQTEYFTIFPQIYHKSKHDQCLQIPLFYIFSHLIIQTNQVCNHFCYISLPYHHNDQRISFFHCLIFQSP